MSASQAGTSRGSGLTSGFQVSTNDNILLFVKERPCISSFIFYIPVNSLTFFETLIELCSR